MTNISANPETPAVIPWLTYGILAVLVAVYVCELVFGVNPSASLSPSIQTLVALGGLNKTVMFSTHEWYRIFTGPLLHAGWVHLIFNGVALFFCGIVLERLVGRFWFFAFFVIGALGGSLMSLAANPPDVTSVGASGAIMSLFAALFTNSFRLPHGARRSRIQIESIRILVPSLLPLAATSAAHIDIGAHLGGAISGALAAFILLKLWPQNQAMPPYQKFAALLATLGLVAFLFSASSAWFHYPGYVKKLALLMPDNEIPRNNQAIESQSAELLRHYPHDPRAHIYRAEALILEHNPITARLELEAGLADAESYRFMYGLRLSNTIRILLALIWIDDGAEAQARKTAEPACKATPDDRPDEKTWQLAVKYHLCE